MHKSCRQVDILDITLERHTPSLLVRVGVVANLVALVEYALVEVGVHLYILAKHEEGGLGIVTLECGENPLGNAWRGAVVERKEDSITILSLPDEIGEEAF